MSTEEPYTLVCGFPFVLDALQSFHLLKTFSKTLSVVNDIEDMLSTQVADFVD